MNDAQLIRAMRTAYFEATKSPDPSTQNGAAIVSHDGEPVALGCNEFPANVDYRAERWERPGKYQWIEHAERNAIYAAARTGVCCYGLTMVCPWAACADCARALVCSGISKLVRIPLAATNARWDESCATGDKILYEGGVEIVEVDYSFPDLPTILRNGEPLQP